MQRQRRCSTTDEGLLRDTLAALRRHDVVLAMVSGTHALAWQNAAPETLRLGASYRDPIHLTRRRLESGVCKSISEFAPQYAGLAPDDPSLEPFYELAEKIITNGRSSTILS